MLTSKHYGEEDSGEDEKIGATEVHASNSVKEDGADESTNNLERYFGGHVSQ